RVGADVGQLERAVVVEVVAVLEAGQGVSRRRVELAAERDRGRAVLGHGAGVAERGRGRDVVEGDGRRVAAEAVVLVEDAALDDRARGPVVEGAGGAHGSARSDVRGGERAIK